MSDPTAYGLPGQPPLQTLESVVKSYLKSKTLWGILVMLFAAWAQKHGAQISPADQGALVDSIMDLVKDAGAALAIIGRATARGPLR